MSDEQGAIPEGMKAWEGGGAAPADWDGGPVLFRNGERVPGCDAASWLHPWDDGVDGAPSRPDVTTPFDIIAYTPAADRLTDTGEGDGQTLVDLLRRASVESDRSEADVLDRVRLSIGKDDTDAWNALLYAAMHLRLEADRTERKRVLATPKPPVDAGAMREAADARERRAALALATCHADALEEHGEPPSWREMARAVFAVTDLSDDGETT